MTNHIEQEQKISRGEPIALEQRERIRALVEKKGLYQAAKLLGCSKDSITKALAGLSLMAGTRALLTQEIGKRDKEGKNP